MVPLKVTHELPVGSLCRVKVLAWAYNVRTETDEFIDNETHCLVVKSVPGKMDVTVTDGSRLMDVRRRDLTPVDGTCQSGTYI